jgi:hypothetical protein
MRRPRNLCSSTHAAQPALYERAKRSRDRVALGTLVTPSPTAPTPRCLRLLRRWFTGWIMRHSARSLSWNHDTGTRATTPRKHNKSQRSK